MQVTDSKTEKLSALKSQNDRHRLVLLVSCILAPLEFWALMVHAIKYVVMGAAVEYGVDRLGHSKIIFLLQDPQLSELESLGFAVSVLLYCLLAGGMVYMAITYARKISVNEADIRALERDLLPTETTNT